MSAANKIVKFIKEYTSGVVFLVFAAYGTILALFFFIFRNYNFIQFDKIKYVLVFLTFWLIASDIAKKREVINKKLHFVFDATIYLACVGLLVYFSGGFDSKLFFIFFLIAASAPVFGGLFGVLGYLFIVGAANYFIYFYSSKEINLYNTAIVTLLVFSYFLIAVIIGFFKKSLLKEQINTKKYYDDLVKTQEEKRSLAEKYSEELERKIKERTVELDAANQQLRATEQQLRAANQQLNAANQQLKAFNQQLNAANQQLKASEEQLQEKLEEVERLNKVMVGRELEMIKLKEEIKKLRK